MSRHEQLGAHLVTREESAKMSNVKTHVATMYYYYNTAC